jgi:hypothetical protein
MDIPQFKDEPIEEKLHSPHAKEYWGHYRDLSSCYVTLLKNMARMMHGAECTLSMLDAKNIENLRHIVNDCLYGAMGRFEAAHPEYRDSNGGLYVRAESLKETIISALQETNHDNGE